MSYILPTILEKKDNTEFKTNRINIRFDNGTYNINIIEPRISFEEIVNLRKPVNPKDLRETNEHLYANLGVSTILTTTIKNNDYLILTYKEKVASLISGYIPSNQLHHPLSTIEQELAEELIPISKEGELVRGLIQSSIEKSVKLPLPWTYNDTLETNENIHIVEWKSRYNLPGFLISSVKIEDKALEGNPRLYFASETNSAQLVYDLHTTLPQNIINNGSLHLAEDYFNKGTNQLEIKTKPYGILLAKVDDEDLTGEFYILRNGKLVKKNTSNLRLSEIFGLTGSKSYGVTEVKDITLEDYLDLQESSYTRF